MIVSEKEAETKACPLAAGFYASQYREKVTLPRCIHRACMAWRIHLAPDPTDEGYGYCGLAGKA